MKEYPDSHIFEKAVLLHLFHNKGIREAELDNILPGMFVDGLRRFIIFIIKKMVNDRIEVNFENLVLFIAREEETVKHFSKKHHFEIPNSVVLEEVLYDATVNSNPALFDVAKKALLRYAFNRFVIDRTEELNTYKDYPGQHDSQILANAKAITKMHEIIYNKMYTKRNQLQEAKEMINSEDEYISTCSQALNGYIGGWTRGYVDALIAKSSHGKSTFTDFNNIHTILSKKVSSIGVITPEESAGTRWRRILSMVFKIPTSAMRQKSVKITDEMIAKLDKMFKNKLVFYDDAFKYKDVMELMSNVQHDIIVVDHLQSIDYPGRGGHLENMINNIPGLVDFQKKLAKKRQNVIINLSQVGDKEIQRSERLIKAPRYWDAYGSSVLYQASREFIALWYPYKDYDDNNMAFTSNIPSMDEFWVTVEKSSFSKIGKVRMKFEPEYSNFTDLVSKKAREGQIYIPPKEKNMEEMGELF